MRRIDESLMNNVFEYICWFQADRGYSPSRREIVERFDIPLSNAHRLVLALAGRSMIEIDDDGTILTPEHLLRYPKRRVPLMGTIRCGQPTTAYQDYDGVMELPIKFTGEKNCFALRAKGDSMIDAGIDDGDYLVIREQNYADSGDIVVAMRCEFSDDADTTLKRYIELANGKCVLRPENDNYDDIDFDGFQIIGKLLTSIKQHEEDTG